MFAMVRTLVRFIMAAALITAYLPMPTPLAKHDGHGRPMACCAPKACCDETHACTSGGHCGGKDVAAGAGPRMFAGGCDSSTPSVTPVQLDPTVSPQVAGSVPVPAAIAALQASDAHCSSLASPPLVPPPRA
jgi:hypothetical protein